MMIALILVVGRWGEGDRKNREAFASVSGTIRISDLEAPIEVLRDAHGIPHISADREKHGWFGLGFTHGQDRLAQMIWMRRRAQGRSAEIVGAEALGVDRLARLLEIDAASHAVVAKLPESTLEILEAYSAGVNARISRIRQDRAEAPRWLNEPAATLENWQPSDSVAIGKLLSWCMGGTLETTLLLDELIQRLDSVPARPFFPGGSSVDFGVAPALPSGNRSEPARSPLHALVEQQLTRKLCAGIGIPTGAAWIIEGRASESGSPILVADWHLEPAVPALFYEAEIDAAALDIAGVTIPGSPIFWAGRNRGVAWAGVPASAPVADLFIETLREERRLYQNGRVWAPLGEREEIIRYRDARGELVDSKLRVLKTRHGPLIEALFESTSVMARDLAPAVSQNVTDGGADSAGQESGARVRRSDLLPSARALSWTGARAGDGMTSMLGLIRAGAAVDVISTLENHHEPVLAVAFADRAGDGGVQVAGWLPKRPLPTGLVPVQGRLRSFDWRDPVPLSKLPSIRFGQASSSGWVIAADQPWRTQGGLDQMEWLWRSGERARRIDAGLAAQRRVGKIDLRGASEMVHDDLAQRAPRVVASLLLLARSEGPLPQEADEIAALLERWDGSMSTDSRGAAAYHLVIEHLLEELLREPFGDTLFEHYLVAPHIRSQHAVESLLLRAARLRKSGGWTDEVRVAGAARTSLRGAWVSLNHRLGPTRGRWTWGELHRLRFRPVGRERPLSGPLARDVAIAGDSQTLSFAKHRPGVSFQVESAGVYRVAMDLASSDHLLSALAPGQSEHPGHPHFADGIARWAATRLALFATNRLVIEAENSERLLLEPAP
jgi:penicillin amidase